MPAIKPPTNLAAWNQFGEKFLPGLIGLEIVSMVSDAGHARMTVRQDLLAPNGYLHAASVVALADTACGYATLNNLPDGAQGFTTIELKANFVGTALGGDVHCKAGLVHSGRTTQVWDAEVRADKAGKVIAHFRCTQMILWAEH